jgi:ubiquinone/menaquinone biosynthesis C-methylase UbiE
LTHRDEYTDAMIRAMDLIWGEGFMAPGGEGNLAQLVRGLELDGRDVLDIGCGQGRPACLLAQRYGARVTGTDLEAHLIDRARRRVISASLEDRVRLLVVEPGPLGFADGSFDAVLSSGAMTQIEDKTAMYRECLRVLRPGGALSCYDWMTNDGSPSSLLRYWFELEGLTYALRTPEAYRAMLAEAGFRAIELRDKSGWYRKEARREYGCLRGSLRPRLEELLGAEDAASFIESWRVLAELCESGELLQVHTRAFRPGGKASP